MSAPAVPQGPAALARTLLFVPGTAPERFAKAAASGADLVVIDLEDAVPDADKDRARQAAVAWLAGPGRAAVRVNGTGTAAHARDVEALAGLPGLEAVVVPMAQDPAALEDAHRRVGPGVGVVALVETAVGLLRAAELAATPGVVRLAFGHLDFAADIGAGTDDDAMLMARSTLVVASRAAGLVGPVDGVTTDLDDPAVCAADAARAARLGFTGKLCIHPRQVEVVAAAFRPSPEQVAWARRVVEAAATSGAVRVDGHMVDAPVIVTARAILARAKESA